MYGDYPMQNSVAAKDHWVNTPAVVYCLEVCGTLNCHLPFFTISPMYYCTLSRKVYRTRILT